MNGDREPRWGPADVGALPAHLVAAQRAAGLPECTFDQLLAAAPADARALHRVLLASLATGEGVPPTAEAAAAAGLTADRARAALAELVAAELVAADAAGAVTGVFPLSAVPTRHVVRLDDGRRLYAMCAVDALGVPAMLGRPATVDSADPGTGRPVRVEVPAGNPGDAPEGDAQPPVPDPPEAVVLLARTGTGPLASECCSVIDFYDDPTEANAALEQRGMTGVVLPLRDAHALGVALFGRLPAT
ncbi:alkylmercury lyase family protein [Candidatus Blastococcus massiliensis]|uniref:alkylmercury lyase family protein n=1 Tax=Candidatus Blastococcus massiliensis TaxID=1470358 RepID=UPI0004AFE008|nr:alkylmercury lyase family protein [Candidatus Blastococcus massiliensis]